MSQLIQLAGIMYSLLPHSLSVLGKKGGREGGGGRVGEREREGGGGGGSPGNGIGMTLE